MSIINKKKQRKQIKTTLQYKKNHTSHAEKCCFLLTLGKQKGINKSENKTLYSGGKMGYTDNMSPEMKQRIVQELVPGKQISLAHIIANPDKILYTKLGLDPSLDYSRAAIGIMTVSPAETAIIMADIAMKSSGIELGFVDRFSGSLIITGTVSEVEASTSAILDYVGNKLGFTLCPITRT